MNRLLFVVLGLCFTAGAVAQDNLQTSLESSFYSSNANHQNNYAFGSGSPSMSTFTRESVTCESPTLTFGFLPNYTGGDFYRQRTIGFTAGFSYRKPLGKTVSLCWKRQRSLVRQAERQADYDNIMMCIELKSKGIVVDPGLFDFASKCHGVTLAK